MPRNIPSDTQAKYHCKLNFIEQYWGALCSKILLPKAPKNFLISTRWSKMSLLALRNPTTADSEFLGMLYLVLLGISRGQAKPRGSRVRVPAGTGAGRPGNTPDPRIPDPCIPESVTRPRHTRHAGGCVLYNLAGCTTPTTPPLWRGRQP